MEILNGRWIGGRLWIMVYGREKALRK